MAPCEVVCLNCSAFVGGLTLGIAIFFCLFLPVLKVYSNEWLFVQPNRENLRSRLRFFQ